MASPHPLSFHYHHLSSFPLSRMKRRKVKTFISGLFTRHRGRPKHSSEPASSLDLPSPSVPAGRNTMTYPQESLSTETQSVTLYWDDTHDTTEFHIHHPGGILNNATDIILHNPLLVDSSLMYSQSERNTMAYAMKLLSSHVTRGVAHDDSARSPPPRCRPGTRVALFNRVKTWFHDPEIRELLLWIFGPAGVGKSAIVQTLAEHLAEHDFLGASVFISRPTGRSNPLHIFVTIAHQLAMRIEAYRMYIVRRLVDDQGLVDLSIEAQFQTFIVEPFVEKNIEPNGRRWGILLDGLDELEGQDAQCDIIRLISTFALEHPRSPLIWIIASRPESHIVHSFNNPQVPPSHRSENIAVDTSDSYQDVEQFLRSGFKAVRSNFPISVPEDWPSEADLQKLTKAASGMFVYAEVVMLRVGEPDRADPVSQLEALLSAIDHSSTLANSHPWAGLDALYNAIVSSIPPDQWPTAKRLLGTAIYWRKLSAHNSARLDTLRAMSIILGLTRHVIYTCLHKCGSVLSIPVWALAHIGGLTFVHVSFTDYLIDPSRSGEYHVGELREVQGDVVRSLFDIWNKCSGDDVATVSVESAWDRYCWLQDQTQTRITRRFDNDLLHDVIDCLIRLVIDNLKGSAAVPVTPAQLRKVYFNKLCYYLNLRDFWDFARALLENYTPELIGEGLAQEVKLQDLTFAHLDWDGMSPAYARVEVEDNSPKHVLSRPCLSDALDIFVIELKSIQERSPDLQAVIFGSIPEGRVAVFKACLKNEIESDYDFTYYIIPYAA